MSVRRLVAGVATTSLILASAALAAPAQADPSFVPAADGSDIVGVGSDTSQISMNAVAEGYNTGRATQRLASFDATPAGSTVVLRQGATAISRPNGSGAGKTLLYGAGNNTDVDFARSSSSLSDAERAGGLFQFPFAKDTLNLATARTSNAPESISPAQMVQIYSGAVTNWNQVGGASGTIVPMIPQSGSGTRSFFLDQLRAANGGTTPTLAPSVVEVQEHDPTQIQGNVNAVAPFSVGRNTIAGSPLRIEGGFTASRAVYNVVRQADVSRADLQAVFGPDGYVCSAAAKAQIASGGLEQLLPQSRGGVCGVVSQSAATNLATEQVATTTTVAGTSTTPGQAVLTATVNASTAPSGLVSFTVDGAPAGSAALTGGRATRTLTGLTAGAHTVIATFAPSANSVFTGSASASTAFTVVATPATTPTTVKAKAKVKESFPAKVKAGQRVKGTITIKPSTSGVKVTGKVVVKLKKKTVGKAKLKNGRAKLTLKALPKGKHKLKVTFVPGSAAVAGTTRTITITQL